MVKREGMVMESKWEHYRRTEARSDEIRRRGTTGVGILGRGNGTWQKKKKDKIRTKALYDKIKAWWTGD